MPTQQPTYRHLIRAHDPSHHGGTVLPQPDRRLIAGKPQALIGDLVHCPRCQGRFPIIGWPHQAPLAIGLPAAAGMVTECGAIVQATQKQQSLVVDFKTMARALLTQFAEAPQAASAFQDVQHSRQNPFAKDTLIAQLNARLDQTLCLPNVNTPYIQQGPSSLCGPACFAHCLLQDRPDLYTAAVIALWQHGQASLGDLMLKPSRHTTQPRRFTLPDNHGSHTYMPMVDWILLASIKDSSNKLLPYTSPHSKTAGITFWFHLQHWFSAVGAKYIDHYYSPIGSHRRHLSKFYPYGQSQHDHAIALIGAGMLQNGRGRFSNHWVVLNQPPGYHHHPPQANTPTDLNLFSWGQSGQQSRPNLTYKRFKQHLYGLWLYGQIP